MYTWERGAGLGMVDAASFSVICPGLHYKLIQLLCNGQNFSLIGKLTSTITPFFGSIFKEQTSILGRPVLILVGLLQPLFPLFV
jgi:hypothetical protein